MRRLIALEVGLGIALALVAVLERTVHLGVHGDLLLVAFLLAPLHARRLLAVAGRGPAPAWPLHVLEALAVGAALLRYPPGGPAVWPATAVALLLACSSEGLGTDGVRALRATRPLVLLGALVAVITVALRPEAGARTFALLVGAALLPCVAEMRTAHGGPAAAVTHLSGPWSVALLAGGAGPVSACGAAILAGLGAASRLTARRNVQQPARALRRLHLRTLAVVAAVVLPLAAFEVGLRVVPNRYRETVTTISPFHVPGAKFRWEGSLLGPRVPPELVVELTWNSRGWHDVEHAALKPPGVVRLVVLGDSFVESVMTPTERLYHLELARRLEARRPSGPRVEAIALAWSGWGQVQALEAYRREGRSYSPDLVILEFLAGNDVRNNHEQLEEIASQDLVSDTALRTAHVRALQAGWLSAAALFDGLDQALRPLDGRTEWIEYEVYRESAPPARAALWAEAWSRTIGAVQRLDAEARAAGARLVVVGFTTPAEIEARVKGAPRHPTLDFGLPARRMREACAKLGVPFLDLADRFARRERGARETLHLVPWDGHWSVAGHQAAAEETARFLDEETEVWGAIAGPR